MFDRKLLVPIVACILLIAGVALAYTPGIYRYDVQMTVDGDHVDYKYDSNVGAETQTVSFTISGQYDVDRVILYLDELYASTTSMYFQKELAGDFGKQLSIRSIDSFETMTAAELEEFMSVKPDGRTAVMFASGAFPDILYDGTAECILMKWILDGGIMVNTSGCLGKYISHGPDASDIELCNGYGNLFAGVEDDRFNDFPTRVFASTVCNEEIRDSLQFYMNEYTYGIDISGMPNALNLGYVSEDNYSAAVLFRTGNGMVMNFGTSVVNHVHSDQFIAQIIASGIDYSSELLDIQKGNTRGDDSGQVMISDGPCTVYGFIGIPRAIYAERLIIPS